MMWRAVCGVTLGSVAYEMNEGVAIGVARCKVTIVAVEANVKDFGLGQQSSRPRVWLEMRCIEIAM